MKYNPRQLHLQHNIFPSDIKASVVTKFSKTFKCWEFVAWKCLHCDTALKYANAMSKHQKTCKELNTTRKEKEMPIQVVTKNGERMYRWGDHGKLYKNRSDAEKQAQAAYASGYKEPQKDMAKK